MSEKTIRNLDIYVPNFDDMLLERLERATPEQLELMPSTLRFKVFKKGKASIDFMNFNEKLYILSVCFKQSIIIATLDENHGVSGKDFNKALAAQKGKVNNKELLENMQIPALFVQCDKELMRAWQYISYVQCSEIYTLIKGAHPREKSKREIKYLAYQRALAGVMKTICNYEGQKKSIIIQFKMSVPELYALLYFYDGEKSGKDFYTVAFRHAYTSNRGDLGGALMKLYTEGYLDRRGTLKQLKYSITSTGIERVTRVMNKLIYNY